MRALRNRIIKIGIGLDRKITGPGGVLIELRTSGYLSNGRTYKSLADIPCDERSAFLFVPEPHTDIDAWAAEAAKYKPPTIFEGR